MDTKAGSCLLTLITIVALFCGSQPTLAQAPPIDPNTSQQAIVYLDPAPNQTWQPYTMTVPMPQLSLPPVEPIVRVASAHMADYVELDTLAVIYTNTPGWHMTAAQAARTQEQVRKTETFIWRNSHLKLDMNITILVMDQLKDASEFKNFWPHCDWLTPNDLDGDGESVEADLLARGVTPGQYDSINLLWAHGSGLGPACAGGLTWPHGWSWPQLGHTAITTNALFDREDIWNPFHHEFQHSIDGMFELSGNSAYFNADDAFHVASGRFGENWNFHVVQMRLWPVSDWFDLLPRWGRYMQTPDNDDDGVPDANPALPFDEVTIGSVPTSIDTDQDNFNDLQEAMGGQFQATNPTQVDTDSDGVRDGADFEPLYAVSPTISFRQQALGNATAQWSSLTNQLIEANTPFAGSIAANWDANFLYLQIALSTPGHVAVGLDANADGWFRGRDNYNLNLDPTVTEPANPYAIRWLSLWDCSTELRNIRGNCMHDTEEGYPFGRQVTVQDLQWHARRAGNGYLIQLAIPRNPATGLELVGNEEIGLRFHFQDLNWDWRQWARPFEEDDMVYVRLADAPSILLSTSNSGTIGNLSFADEDILRYSLADNRWSIYFDGSDVGIKDDVDAFALMPDGSLLLSVGNPIDVRGLGRVDDSDVIQFIPTRLGWTTTGSFAWYLDGSDVGLTTDSEDVDALALTPAGHLIVSTLGNVAAPGVTGADEDLLTFRATCWGATTSGTWRILFDGSDVGLRDTSEDVGGAWLSPVTGDLYLTTAGNFQVIGLAGPGSEIFRFHPTTLGVTTAGLFQSFWRGADHGLSGKVIDDFELVDTLSLPITAASEPETADANEPFTPEVDDELYNDIPDEYPAETAELPPFDLFLPYVQP